VYYWRPDTLAAYKSRAVFKPVSGLQDCAATTAGLRAGAFKEKQPTIDTIRAAIDFYVGNHAFMEIERKRGHHRILTPAEHEFVDGYVGLAGRYALYMIYYTLTICTRETRHAPPSQVTSAFYQTAGTEYAFFHTNHISGVSSHAAAQAFWSGLAPGTVGKYITIMREFFYQPIWGGGSIGGPKWGHIAECARRFVYGEISPVILLDTGFTLAHNGGPMFNKGFLFSHPNADALYRVLDVQNSGQLPKLCVADLYTSPLVQLAQAACPEIFDGPVDWYKVEKDGSKKQYPGEKVSQTPSANHKAYLVAPGVQAEIVKPEREAA